MSREIKIKTALLLIFSLWILFIFSEPVFFSNKVRLIAYPFAKKGLNLICHQQQSKLIEFGSYHTLLCARCTGIYVGVLFGLMISFFTSVDLKINHKLFTTSVFLMLLDILFYDYLSIYHYNKIIAFLTGLFLGSTVFNYFWKSLIQIKEKI